MYKIYRLCQLNNSVEWSSILFYKESAGSIEDPGSLKLEVVDMLLMDIGNHTYTEYDFDADFVSFLSKNPTYMEYNIGHIHSHNNMDTFFSGTDMTELKDNSPNHNYYLSLIVNNKGNMCAKVAVNTVLENENTLVSTYRKRVKGKMETIRDEDVKTFTTNSMEDYDCIINLESDASLEERIDEVKDLSAKRALEKAAANRAKYNHGSGYPHNTTTNYGNGNIPIGFGKHSKTKHKGSKHPDNGAMPNSDLFNDNAWDEPLNPMLIVCEDDDEFTQLEVLRFTNLLLGNAKKTVDFNLQTINRANHATFEKYKKTFKSSVEHKFKKMFPGLALACLGDLLDEVASLIEENRFRYKVVNELADFIRTDVSTKYFEIITS